MEDKNIKDNNAIAYHSLCDLAEVPYDTSLYNLTIALHKKLFPDGVKPIPNRAQRRKKND